MRYPEEHKAEVRGKILAAAAKRFRAQGFDATSVAQVMRDAGLTHGGFYAYFESKDALVAAVIDDGFDHVSDRFEKHFDGLESETWLRAWVDGYLGRTHFEHTAEGCPLPALSPEIARSGPEAIAAFTRLAHHRYPRVTAHIDAPPAEAKRRVLAAFTQLVGALMIARAIEEPLSGEVRAAASEAAFATLTGRTMPARARRKPRPDPLAEIVRNA